MTEKEALKELKRMKKMYEDFGLALIGEKINVQMTDSFWFQYSDNIIGVAVHIPSDMFEELIQNFFNSIGAEGLNAYVVGFLHELGHFWSKKVYKLDSRDFQEALLEAELLDITAEAKGWTFEETLAKYYQIQTEFCANEFVRVALQSKKDIIINFNSKIEEYYKEIA